MYLFILVCMLLATSGSCNSRRGRKHQVWVRYQSTGRRKTEGTASAVAHNAMPFRAHVRCFWCTHQAASFRKRVSMWAAAIFSAGLSSRSGDSFFPSIQMCVECFFLFCMTTSSLKSKRVTHMQLCLGRDLMTDT